MTKRESADYINDIVESCDAVKEFISGMDFAEFKKDRKTRYATTRAIEVIGEAVKNIPSGIKSRYPKIPWKEIAGMRDKLIHEYFGIDIEVLWKTANEDVKQVKKMFEEVLRDM